MIDLSGVLIATDFSESSGAALAEGCALAAAFGATLHVLNVITRPLHEIWASYAPAEEFNRLIHDLEDRARRELDHLAAPGALANDRVVRATAWGDPSDEILRYAREHDVNLIVCGTHGRRGWDRVVMGSVAERVVRLAPCPVLTVPPARGVRELSDDVRRVQRTAAAPESLLAS